MVNRTTRPCTPAWALPVLLCSLSACPLPTVHPVPTDLPSDPAPSEPDPAARGVVEGYPALQVTVRGPTRAAYDPRAIGLSGKWATIRVSNTGNAPVAIGAFRATFLAARDNVVFPCDEHRSGNARSREPAVLGPGQSFDYERDLDCSMPLPGSYDVRVYVRVGDRTAPGQPTGHFPLQLIASKTNAPQPYPARDGLFVLMTGAQLTRPLSAEAWARGDYHVVLAFINGSPKPIAVGPARIAFLVYKLGTPLPCSGQAGDIAPPAEIGPGSVHIVQAPVACAPSQEGDYSIVGKLNLVGLKDEVEVGRIPLRVSGDPRLFAPSPWRPGNDWPSTPLPR